MTSIEKLAVIVTLPDSAPGGTTSVCGPTLSEPPHGPIVAVDVAGAVAGGGGAGYGVRSLAGSSWGGARWWEGGVGWETRPAGVWGGRGRCF